MEANTLTWAVMIGLVTASTAACSTSSGGGSAPSYAPDHPCYGKGNCEFYLRLPDGGATKVPEGGTDAGTTAMCGPCNG